MNRWTEHFKEVFNEDQNDKTIGEEERTPDDIRASQNSEDPEAKTPSIREIEQALKRLKNHKSAGIDNIPAELLKYGGPELLKAICSLIETIWNSEKMPSEWDTGLICPLHKKGDTLECKNYRGIALLNAAYKVLANVISIRLSPYAENIIGNYQAGFRANRSTIDQIFTLRQILEKTQEYNIDTHHMFVDFKAAYDSVIRQDLCEAMAELGIPEKLIRMVKLTLRNTECRVKVQNSISDPFNTRNGLKQGDALSCTLFNIALEKCVRMSGIESKGTILQKSTQILGYADDIDIVGRTQENMIEAFQKLEASAKEMGLKVNAQKTKYLQVGKNPHTQRSVTVNGQEYERTDSFVYLGTLVTADNDVSEEIRKRIIAANKCFYGLLRHLKSRLLTRKTKLSIYKTLIRPVLTYGSECWVISKKDEDILLRFERKILRRILGAVMENGAWRPRHNHELYHLFGSPSVIQQIKIGRMRWAGHVQRMEEDRPARKIFAGMIDGRRKVGRPKLRWADGVRRDAASCGITDWRTRAQDGEAWRGLLKEAMACQKL